jgi:hypothetical protein
MLATYQPLNVQKFHLLIVKFEEVKIMLLERLTVIPDEEVKILRDRASAKSVLNLQDPNTAVTELIRAMGYREFKTVDANTSRWAMQATLLQVDTSNTYKMQVFLNINGANNVYVQVEIVRLGDQPQILLKGNFNTTQALELINKLPYFPHSEGMNAEH